MNRAVSLRSSKGRHDVSPAHNAAKSHRFTFGSLRGNMQPQLSKRLYKLIKTENVVISAYETAAKEQQNVAGQLSLWGDETGDESISDISDKLGVVLSEIAEVEDNYASALEASRQTLKQIRNTESSVHPTRENKTKITDQIAHLKHKDPASPKIMTLEQELVRAEAENLVAEAQLTNITRQKLKEAYTQQINAIIERSEKQAILARHARRLLELLDDSPVVPGADRPAYDNERAAKEVLLDAEEELGRWEPSQEGYQPSTRLESNLLPAVGDGASNGDETNHKDGISADSGAYNYDPKVIEAAT